MRGLTVRGIEQDNGNASHFRRACTDTSDYSAIWAFDHKDDEIFREVRCDACLLLMFLAIEPMRRDTLLIRGLIQEPIAVEQGASHDSTIREAC